MTHTEVSYKIPPGAAQRYEQEGYTPVFSAYDCLLLERRYADGYIYKAMSLETGKLEHLCQRNIRLPAAGHGEMAKRIRNLSISGSGRTEADARLGQKTRLDKLLAIQNTVFKEHLPKHGFAVRRQQIELAEHILNVIAGQGITLAEAEVGTGKTHAYLIASILAKRGRINDFWIKGQYPGISYATSMPVVVATSSIALQRAILQEYIPAISSILLEVGVISTPLSAVLRKGKEHYVCDLRLRSCYINTQTDAKSRRLLARLLDNPAHLDLGEMPQIPGVLKKQINVAGPCDRNCPQIARCRYNRFMRGVQSDKHDLQICNHNYLLADVLRRHERQQPLIPHYQGIVIDEAHKFIEACRQMYGAALPSHELTQIALDVQCFTLHQREGTAQLHRAAQRLGKADAALFEKLHRQVQSQTFDEETERFSVLMSDAVLSDLRSLRHAVGGVLRILESRKVSKRYAGRCAQVLWQLTQTQKQLSPLEKQEDWVYWLEKPNGAQAPKTLLCAIPKQLGEILYRDMWENRVPVVLTSGTLSSGSHAANNGFAHVKRLLGLNQVPPERLAETTKASPFNHQDNALLYISRAVPFPNTKDKRYISAVADEVVRLVEATHGHTVVLFTSYKAMGLVLANLGRRKQSIPFPLFCLNKGGTTEIDRFRSSGNGVLFASGSLWEGIDLPGDILSSLIIIKLPFAVPDPISEYEKTLYDNIAEYKREVVVPEMLVKLKQGFGRLIRSETDTGVVALLDSRVRAEGGYHKRVLEALPNCGVTGDIEAVRGFIQTKKEPEYFAA